MKIYYVRQIDLAADFFGAIHSAATADEVEALVRKEGLPVSQATNTCDADGNTTNDDSVRVWLVLP